MSSTAAAGTKNVEAKSKIPVPKSRIPVPKSRIPVTVTTNALHKNKSNATSLQKTSVLPQKGIKAPALSKVSCTIQKLPENSSVQFTKSEQPQNKTAKFSKLSSSNKSTVKPPLQCGRSNEQNKIVKQASHPSRFIDPKKSNICVTTAINENLPKQRPSKISNVIANKNSRLYSNSDSCKNNLMHTKVLPKLTAREGKGHLLKKVEPTKNEIKKEVQKAALKVNVKKNSDNSNKRLDMHKNDAKQSVPKATVKVAVKENKVPAKTDYFASQKDIKFEANELFRNMILSNRELSPGILKLDPGLKLSSVYAKRPSAYQEFVVPPDPFKEALKAIENVRLSMKKDRKPVVIKENKVPISPFRDRNSFYTPCSNPKLEAMKSIEAFKKKQLLKNSSQSVKKVTFNLNIQECTPKDRCDISLTPFKSSECRLTQISEKSEENTPNSPESKGDEAPSVKQALNDPTTETCINENMFLQPKAASENSETHDNGENSSKLCEFSKFVTPVTKSIRVLSDIPSNSMADQSANGTKKIADYAISENLIKRYSEFSSPVCDKHKFMCTSSIKDLRRMSFQTSLPNNGNKSSIQVYQAKVCTPRPISLFAKSSLIDISSPEFLADGIQNKFLSDFAPIQTPLVLRSLARSSALSPVTDLSPIRLKLDFTEDKDSPKGPTKTHPSMYLKKIATAQKLLDDLADRECYLCLLNESIPVVCGRYLQNPVALTLSEGDDMHFIPVGFQECHEL